jgi:hypothetical protein
LSPDAASLPVAAAVTVAVVAATAVDAAPLDVGVVTCGREQLALGLVAAPSRPLPLGHTSVVAVDGVPPDYRQLATALASIGLEAYVPAFVRNQCRYDDLRIVHEAGELAQLVAEVVPRAKLVLLCRRLFS